jgi:hypothetical protein
MLRKFTVLNSTKAGKQLSADFRTTTKVGK